MPFATRQSDQSLFAHLCSDKPSLGRHPDGPQNFLGVECLKQLIRTCKVDLFQHSRIQALGR